MINRSINLRVEILAPGLNVLVAVTSFRMSRSAPAYLMLQDYQWGEPFRPAPPIYTSKFSGWSLLPLEVNVIALVHGNADLPWGLKLEPISDDTLAVYEGVLIAINCFCWPSAIHS